MANKRITELQLRDDISDDLNFPSDDGIQSYRVTAAQMIEYIKSKLVVKKLIGTQFFHNAASAPTYALACDGAAVSRTTYADLFAVIGTTFGSGDGSTTFNLPDDRAMVMRATGSQTVNSRSKSGPSLGAIQEDQMQGHKHSFDTVSAYGTQFPSGGSDSAGGGAAFQTPVIGSPSTDGSNGTPRTGAETRVTATGKLSCIWALPIPLEDI